MFSSDWLDWILDICLQGSFGSSVLGAKIPEGAPAGRTPQGEGKQNRFVLCLCSVLSLILIPIFFLGLTPQF